MRVLCAGCGQELSGEAWASWRSGHYFCDNCKHDIEKCQHEEGHIEQHYDGTGCGYLVWHCDACPWSEIDDMA